MSWPIIAALWTLTRFPLAGDPTRSKIEEVALFLGVATPVVLILVYLERHMAAQPEQRVSKDDLRTDLTHLAMCWFAVNPIAQALLGVMTMVLAGSAASKLGLGVWPTRAPLLAQLALAVVVGEFGQYWFHRIAHQWQLAWRLHATHHGTPQVYWLNSTRFHAFELIFKSLLQVGPLIVLGCSHEAFLMYGTFTAIHGWVQHSNVDFRTGFLNYLMSTPQNHRWHHSQVLSEGNTNYGVVTPLWDHVFRTWFSPRDRVFSGPVGIPDMPEFPKTYFQQFLTPFTWRRLARTAPGQPAPTPPQQAQDEVGELA
ncbi:MAG: sterol desaturase family protein [Archangiaceae bacterium]|nr:sterol desaturase family protein [Archangiaceae bacterium]